MANDTKLILVNQIESLIHEVRGQKIMLDSDLAGLYGVETGALNRAVKRNSQRFPTDFVFQLTAEEVESLRCQIGISNVGRGGRRHLPYVFTEHGAFMASVNSPRAVEVSVFVVRAFVKLRQLVLSHKDLAAKLDQLERKVSSHDEAIKQLIAAMRQLMAPPEPPPNQMGFHAIRDSAKAKSPPTKPTSSAKTPKRRSRADT